MNIYSSLLTKFWEKNLRIYKTSPNSNFKVPNSSDLTYLIGLCVTVNHWCEHIFGQVWDSLNPNYNCGNAIDSTNQYLLLRKKCPNTEFFLVRIYTGVFGQNTEIYFVNLRIQSKYGKIRTRKNSVFEHFSRSVLHCSNFKNERQGILQNIGIVNANFLFINENALTHLLINNTLTDNAIIFLLNSVIEYITSIKCFNDTLILYRKS